jgi:hypothetical protein
MRRVIFGNYTDNYQPGTGLRSKKRHQRLNILLNTIMNFHSFTVSYVNGMLQDRNLGASPDTTRSFSRSRAVAEPPANKSKPTLFSSLAPEPRREQTPDQPQASEAAPPSAGKLIHRLQAVA